MAKGGDFEREISKLLSLWWTEGEREDIFYRSHASGGRFTSRRKTGKDTALQGGDITASDPVGEPLVKEWSVETKTGYGKKNKTGVSRWDILDFIDSQQKTPVLQKMWEQCERDALLSGRKPILIFRRNSRSPCIMFYLNYYKHLQDYFGKCPYTYINLTMESIDFIIMPLQSFFEWIPNIRSALCSNQSQSKTSKVTGKRILRSPKV